MCKQSASTRKVVIDLKNDDDDGFRSFSETEFRIESKRIERGLGDMPMSTQISAGC